MNESYGAFIAHKTGLDGQFGFHPTFIPSQAFDFQRALIEWAVRKGRAAIFADCGMGKTLMELAFAENVVRRENKPVLLLTPLAVAGQIVREAQKFGIHAERSTHGRFSGNHVVVTNYERLHYFNPEDFAGTVCDESSILKNFDGVTKEAVTQFMSRQKYRLLATATAAPNDFIELGTSSEALGYLGYMDMLGKFFKKSEATISRKDENRSGVYRLRGHAEQDFWRWVCSWARAIRKPSDMGFDDRSMQLPPLNTREHVVQAQSVADGMLFDMPAVSLEEQRAERKRTLKERCEMAAKCADTKEAVVLWCHLNAEGDLLNRMVEDAEQVSGDDTDDRKEELFEAFQSGQIRALVTKPSIAGFGLNWHHCHHQTFFPSHSFEQWYQAIRRSWRFGQKQAVNIDVVCSEGERGVLANLQRKAANAEKMFERLVSLMNDELKLQKHNHNTKQTQVPSWLSATKS
jgi:hypothetical protein